MITKENNDHYQKRADELVAQMTLEEKVMQMVHTAPAIDRLAIKSYNWWNEALHGVARAGVATVFPQAISLAATFDDKLVYQVGDVVSTEGRAKYNEFQRQHDHGMYKGLTYWSPNINIFRDPRWGRGHETYGEDPCLTARMGVAYIKGLQGDDPIYLKAAACVKHYAVHSGPEGIRHGFDSKVSNKDLYETYLPAFRACIQQANVEAVMGAYNSINGEVCCGSKKLIQEILREQFGFDGHFVSDCGAIHDFCTAHHVTKTPQESAALAVNAGCDLNCGSVFLNLISAVEDGLIQEETIDRSVRRLMVTRLRLGMLDKRGHPYHTIPYSSNNAKEHHDLSLKAAEECMTLLKNNSILPLDKRQFKKIAVIGPNADSRTVLQGNYNGTASQYFTVLDGIREYLGESGEVIYAQGCHLYKTKVEPCAEDNDRISEAISAVQNADAVVLCIGLDPTIEGEEGDAFNGDGSGDKPDLELPGLQNMLIEQVCAVGKPVIVVSLCGSAVNLGIAQKHADAIIQAWYPGTQGGRAVARLIFGEYSPSGRLPVTFYHAVNDLPPFEDYDMSGRTYRYFEKKVLYPFGFGLSYTKFEYSNLVLDETKIEVGKNVCCQVDVTNAGNYDSDEVVQLYIRDDKTSVPSPKYQLKGFSRLHIKAGETQKVTFTILPQDMECVLEDGSSIIEPGSFTVWVGGGQPDELTLEKQFEVVK